MEALAVMTTFSAAGIVKVNVTFKCTLGTKLKSFDLHFFSFCFSHKFTCQLMETLAVMTTFSAAGIVKVV